MKIRFYLGGKAMVNKKNGKKMTKEEIKIDYENIDVADIMDQIKRKVAEKPKKPERESGREDWRFASPSLYPLEPEEAPGSKAKIRGLILKIMRPFAPLIKLFILPVYEELRETVRILDQTNKRIDYFDAKLNDFSNNINQINHRLDRAAGDLGTTMEYTKLLHNLSHNVVVELSKLKIEEENLKLKTRIMEKDFESLGKRERALEKHIFK